MINNKYHLYKNKAGYTAQDAPSMRAFSPSKNFDRRTDRRTDGHNLLKRCDGASKKCQLT